MNPLLVGIAVGGGALLLLRGDDAGSAQVNATSGPADGKTQEREGRATDGAGQPMESLSSAPQPTAPSVPTAPLATPVAVSGGLTVPAEQAAPAPVPLPAKPAPAPAPTPTVVSPATAPAPTVASVSTATATKTDAPCCGGTTTAAPTTTYSNPFTSSLAYKTASNLITQATADARALSLAKEAINF